MTSEELREEMKLIGVDDIDEETKRDFILNGFKHHYTCTCLACLRERQQSSQSSDRLGDAV